MSNNNTSSSSELSISSASSPPLSNQPLLPSPTVAFLSDIFNHQFAEGDLVRVTALVSVIKTQSKIITIASKGKLHITASSFFDFLVMAVFKYVVLICFGWV